jgi:hypothetical protein
MELILVFVFLFFGGASFNLVKGYYDQAIAGIFLALVMIGLYWYFRREKKKAEEFANWISINRGQISTNGLDYNGYPVEKDTELVQYQVCISLLVFTVKLSSRYFIKERISSSIARVLYTLATLILGWWAIPFGPIYTIQVLIKNLIGGKKVKVEDMSSFEIAS